MLFSKRKDKIIFWSIIVAKLTLAALFASEYQSKIFIPFTEQFIDSFNNPWDYFLEHNKNVAFPYPPVMLYVMTPFTWLASALGSPSIVLQNLLFKMPILLADLSIFFGLKRLFPNKTGRILLFYFCSPIIIYASFIHSQWDIVPTAILFFAIISMLKDKHIIAAISLGVAFATKSHTLIALPLILIYLAKNKQVKTLVKYILISSIAYFALVCPFLYSRGYSFFVLQNAEQALIFEVHQRMGDLKIYLAPFFTILLFGRFLLYRKINRDLLFGFLGIVFSVFVLFVIPAPGWYVWGIPFISIFFINTFHKQYRISYVYLCISITYLVYFTLFFKHPLNELADITLLGTVLDTKANMPLTLNNLSFTALEATLLATIYSLFNFGVKSNSIYRKETATLIGIGGESGAGKTTLAKDLHALLGKANVLSLEGDSDHKWERNSKEWENYTHLNPKANFLHRQANHLESLKKWQATKRTEYNHSTGKFTKLKKVKPSNFIIISGLHPFFLPKSRKLIDVKIFLEPEDTLRKQWKIERDQKERNYSIQKIEESIQSRMRDSEKHILPQKEYANLILKYYSRQDSNQELGLEVLCNANVNLDELLDICSQIPSISFTHDYSNDLRKQFIKFEGTISAQNIHRIASRTIPNLEELIPENSSWKKDLRGLAQLFALFEASHSLMDESYEI